MDFVSECLTPDHDLACFRCGIPQLDDWLHCSARHAEAMNTARTFVWHRGDRMVVAYFTLAAHLIARAEVPKRVGRGSPDVIPAILLARLALDQTLHGQGLGGELLWDALERARTASRLAGARLVVVDAIDEAAASFYEHHGFRRIPDTRRLVQKLSDIECALGG